MNSELAQESKKPARFAEVITLRIVDIDAESPVIWQRQYVSGMPGPVLPSVAFVASERKAIRSNADSLTPISIFGATDAHACRHFAEKTRAIFETAAVVACACVCTQKLVAEITVAVFDVDEVKAEIVCDTSGGDEVVDDLVGCRRQSVAVSCRLRLRARSSSG